MEFLLEVITRKQILPMAVPFCYDYSHAISELWSEVCHAQLSDYKTAVSI